MDGLGLQDPQGFLFQEMMTWVQGPDLDSKAALRECCRQKLEEMMQPLQVRAGERAGQRRELSRARPAGSSPPLWLCLPGSPLPPSFLCATGGSLGGGLRLGRGQHLSSLPAGGGAASTRAWTPPPLAPSRRQKPGSRL